MDKNVEQRIAELRQKYQELPLEQQIQLKKNLKMRHFLDYKKAELLKSDILRLEARRAQLEFAEKTKESDLLAEKIKLKKEKLLRCLEKQFKDS